MAKNGSPCWEHAVFGWAPLALHQRALQKGLTISPMPVGSSQSDINSYTDIQQLIPICQQYQSKHSGNIQFMVPNPRINCTGTKHLSVQVCKTEKDCSPLGDIPLAEIMWKAWKTGNNSCMESVSGIESGLDLIYPRCASQSLNVNERAKHL